MEISCVTRNEIGEYDFDTATYKEKAEQTGFEVVLGDATHLTLDLDTAEQQQHWKGLLERFADDYNVASITSWKSKSGSGRHVLIELIDEMPFDYRIALQLALGSDRKREYLALLRYAAGAEYPVMLFQPPDAFIEVEYQHS